MKDFLTNADSTMFLKSLGFPKLKVHPSLNHFDFTKGNRRILVVGPMGSGKTEYSSRVWRDSQVVLKKSQSLSMMTSMGKADRRKVFFVRSSLDRNRFQDYPEDALAFRGGYDRLGQNIAFINNSFELETLILENPQIGTWIIDEASFYDERLAYIVNRESKDRGLIFIFPSLILNFRKDIFNSTARLLLEHATDVFTLTAYCEHSDCITDSYYTYRYYNVENLECPALYFDPLIIIGGDAVKEGGEAPNYCTRCDKHHFLPGKEYTYLYLKPFGELASRGNTKPLMDELYNVKRSLKQSHLYRHLHEKYSDSNSLSETNLNALKVPNIAEKAVLYLYAEQNLLSVSFLIELCRKLKLNTEYIRCIASDNNRTINF